MLTNQFTRLAYRRYRMTNGFPFRLSSVPLRFRFHFVLSPIRFLLLFCSIANTAGPVGGGDREGEREGGGTGGVSTVIRVCIWPCRSLKVWCNLYLPLSLLVSSSPSPYLSLSSSLSLAACPKDDKLAHSATRSTVGNWLLGWAVISHAYFSANLYF